MNSSKNKRKNVADLLKLSWREKKCVMDAEEPVLQKEVEDITSWVTLFESMDEVQLKEYVLNRLPPSQYRSTKKTSIKRVYRSPSRGKSVKKCSGSAASARVSNTLMAAVLKFHSQEDDQSI